VEYYRETARILATGTRELVGLISGRRETRAFRATSERAP